MFNLWFMLHKILGTAFWWMETENRLLCWGRFVCVEYSETTKRVRPRLGRWSPRSAMDNRISSWTQREREEYTEEEEDELRDSVVLFIWEVKSRRWWSLHSFVDRSGLFPNIYSQVLFFNGTIKEIAISLGACMDGGEVNLGKRARKHLQV